MTQMWPCVAICNVFSAEDCAEIIYSEQCLGAYVGNRQTE